MDVDGTLTDGKIYMGAKGEMMKAFDIKDGYGIHDILPQIGITPIIITGRSSSIVQNRCKELGITLLYQGVSDKVGKLKEILLEQGGDPSEVAYAGDDLNDFQSMLYVKNNGGLVGVPNDACQQVKNIASFIATSNGGNGAVRDFVDYLFSISCNRTL
jgi:3-deoxy-D-manno-octulosonate 8-phosphate phosphatase (KDO 8-P phosphatase)